MSKKLTRTEALAILAQVIKHHAAVLESGNLPDLVEDWEKTWDSPEPIIPWAIVWHDGPSDWAIRFSHADVIPRYEAFVEPGTGQVLSIWPPD